MFHASRLVCHLGILVLIQVSEAPCQTGPRVSEGLKLWLKAEAGVEAAGGRVGAWVDQSGAMIRLEAPSSASRPEFINDVVPGLSAVHFNGNYELRGSLGTILQEATILSLCRYTIGSSDNDYLYSIGTRGDARMMALSRRSGQRAYQFDGAVQNFPAITTIPANELQVFAQVFGERSPASHDLYQNTRRVLSTTAREDYSVDANTLVVGNFTSGSYRFVGDLVELLVYDRVLSPSERKLTEDYLRQRAGLAPFVDSLDLNPWSVVQFEVNAQGDAVWTVDETDRRVGQSVNADPSIFLGDFDVVNQRVSGTFHAGSAPDFLGLVFGYQGRGEFYLFDWRKTTAAYKDFGVAHQGMRLRVVKVADGDPSGSDLWGSEDTGNVTTLRSNELAWESAVLYHFNLTFRPGLFELAIRQGGQNVESWVIRDSTFTHGRFGFYINSLQGVTFGDLVLTSLGPSSAPVVISQPQDVLAELQGTVTLEAEVSGSSPLRYQWRKNGRNLPGAIHPRLVLENIMPSDGGRYRLLVSNSEGFAESRLASVLVQIPRLPFADHFAEAGLIQSETGTGSGESTSATSEVGEPVHAQKTGGRSIWLRWLSPATGIATFSTSGSQFDTLLAVYEGNSIADLTQITGDEDGGGSLASQVKFNAVSGRQYHIVVDGFAGSGGQVVLRWDLEETDQLIPVILNQPGEQTVELGGVATDRVVATGDDLAYQWFFNGQILPNETLFSWTIENFMLGNVGSYVARIRNGAGREIESQPARVEAGTAESLTSKGKFRDLFGENEVREVELASPLGRAAFATVAQGGLGTQVFSTLGAGTEEGEPLHGGVIGGASRWVGLRAGFDGPMRIDTSGSDFDTAMAVYTGTDLLSLELVAENNDARPGVTHSEVRFHATFNTDYAVAVDGVDGASGLVNLNWRAEMAILAPRLSLDDFLEFEIQGVAPAQARLESSADFESWQTVPNPIIAESTFRIPVGPDRLFYRVASPSD